MNNGKMHASGFSAGLFSFAVFTLCMICTSCYSFRGGSLPEHIKTIQIKAVTDNSGYGNPLYRDNLYNKITEVIRRDNSLRIEDENADSRLTIAISSIREDVVTTSASSQIEKERKITVTLTMEFFDNINRKTIVRNSNLSINQLFLVSGTPTTRDEAVQKCIEILADEVLNAMIEG
ncbi:MAG: LPS assembly lipoprotein LptE [Candidatus Kapabacteria bacterium]|nr:LPS assembly lipoprotein LptE [Candidatus Kapabacteria bacterium]